MSTTRVYLNETIPGLDRHFTTEALAELTLLVTDLYKGRAATEKDAATAEGYIDDVIRAVEILKASTTYPYIDVNAGPEYITARPKQGWNYVLRAKATDNPIGKVVDELRLAGEFFPAPIRGILLQELDVKDYLIGTDARQFYVPDRAVDALEVIVP